MRIWETRDALFSDTRDPPHWENNPLSLRFSPSRNKSLHDDEPTERAPSDVQSLKSIADSEDLLVPVDNPTDPDASEPL